MGVKQGLLCLVGSRHVVCVARREWRALKEGADLARACPLQGGAGRGSIASTSVKTIILKDRLSRLEDALQRERQKRMTLESEVERLSTIATARGEARS
mmetsp:Transcript_62240/g.196972  ORF Transcript_62240/g.196972 Transcript_62240/m.196972 type:complete len:99 (-) Transcript_62240:31-327(-)